MKKLFTFAMALMAAMAINATDYYFAGAANGWSNNNDAWKFVDVEGVLTLEVADLYGEFKVTENGAWHPQHGAAAAGEGVALNGSYNLVKCDDLCYTQIIGNIYSQISRNRNINCTINPKTNNHEKVIYFCNGADGSNGYQRNRLLFCRCSQWME